MTMKTSEEGLKVLTLREGNKLKAYKDTVGVWTIGVGHTSAAGAPQVVQGMTITAAESLEILRRDITDVERSVNKLVKVPLTQNQFDALSSFVLNIGETQFRTSTLLKLLNKGDYAGAARQFVVWTKQPELMGRRKSETAQFLKADVVVKPSNASTEAAFEPVLVAPSVDYIAPVIIVPPRPVVAAHVPDVTPVVDDVPVAYNPSLTERLKAFFVNLFK